MQIRFLSHCTELVGRVSVVVCVERMRVVQKPPQSDAWTCDHRRTKQCDEYGNILVSSPTRPKPSVCIHLLVSLWWTSTSALLAYLLAAVTFSVFLLDKVDAAHLVL